MPISKYYGGNGDEVMQAMQKTYGGDKAKQVFYATQNKMKKKKRKSLVKDMVMNS